MGIKTVFQAIKARQKEEGSRTDSSLMTKKNLEIQATQLRNCEFFEETAPTGSP
jgi:hypothetical protein